MQKQVHPVHFEDFSGHQFERLGFAYLLRRPCFSNVEWYGQLGGDSGRDIVCDHESGSTFIYQCANYRSLTYKKVEADLDKLKLGQRSRDAHFRILVGGKVSAKMRDRVSEAAKNRGFATGKATSGTEFEELLRLHSPDLLKRFTEGVPFPEVPAELAAFSASAKELTDQQIVDALAVAFDRPAFKTPFHMESSLPRFKEAIAQTIDTLNTGTTPSGKVLPSKNDIRDPAKRSAVSALVVQLAGLRAAFDKSLSSGTMRRCGCGDHGCPVYMMHPEVAAEMDARRAKILNDVHSLSPAFDPDFYSMD